MSRRPPPALLPPLPPLWWPHGSSRRCRTTTTAVCRVRGRHCLLDKRRRATELHGPARSSIGWRGAPGHEDQQVGGVLGGSRGGGPDAGENPSAAGGGAASGDGILLLRSSLPLPCAGELCFHGLPCFHLPTRSSWDGGPTLM
jgi:hypothetical protein